MRRDGLVVSSKHKERKALNQAKNRNQTHSQEKTRQSREDLKGEDSAAHEYKRIDLPAAR